MGIMPEKRPLGGPALLVSSLLFLLGLIAFIIGVLRILDRDSIGGGLCLLTAAFAFGFLLLALSRTPGNS